MPSISRTRHTTSCHIPRVRTSSPGQPTARGSWKCGLAESVGAEPHPFSCEERRRQVRWTSSSIHGNQPHTHMHTHNTRTQTAYIAPTCARTHTNTTCAHSTHTCASMHGHITHTYTQHTYNTSTQHTCACTQHTHVYMQHAHVHNMHTHHTHTPSSHAQLRARAPRGFCRALRLSPAAFSSHSDSPLPPE